MTFLPPIKFRHIWAPHLNSARP